MPENSVGLERLAAVGVAGRFALSDLSTGTFTVHAVTAHDRNCCISGRSVGMDQNNNIPKDVV